MSANYLKDIINSGSHDAIKHWLKISGIRPFSAQNNVAFFAMLEKHISEGKVRIDQLRRLSIELEEYGGKRVYLGKLSDYKTIGLKQRFENHLGQLGLALDLEPVKARQSPAKPHLNYICWSNREVRIGYSETHQSLKQNRSTMTLEYVPYTNLITISADPSRGTVKIMMDAPGDKHPHQSSVRGQPAEDYVTFYRTKALELLGAGEFRTLDLSKVATEITKLGKDVFEEIDAYERTARNTRQRTWSRSSIRDDPAYVAGTRVDGDKRVVESLSGWWHPEGSDGVLHRTMWMHLSRTENMLQFPANHLAVEVEYAISRIREI